MRTEKGDKAISEYNLKVIFDLGLNGDPEIPASNRIMNMCCQEII